MNSQQYWRKRTLYAKKKELDAEADYEVAMRSRLKDLENEFVKESKKWFAKYAKENNQTLKQAAEVLKNIDTTKFDMTLAEFEAKARAGGFDKELNSAYYKSRIVRLQELYKQYQALAAKYAENEEQNMAVGLAKQYQDTYLLDNYNKYLVVGSTNINLTHFNEQQLKDIVYQPWQGSDFSKRIWNNYTNVMPEVLTDTMLRATVMGYSYQDVERSLRGKFQGVVKSDLHRLVVTEMGHAAEQATLKFYHDSHIEQYEYMATLESHTCDVCGHLDGKVFNVKDKIEGVNYPLIHPYCRCSTCPYDESLPQDTPRWYRDPVTGKGKWTEGSMTFDQWKQAQNVKPHSFKQWKKINGVKPLNLKMFKALPKPESKVRSLSKQLIYDDEGTKSFIPTNTLVENVKVIAGKGANRALRIAKTLVNKFGYTESDWKKCVGSVKSDKYLFDVHWFEVNHDKMYLPKIKSYRRRKK